jgi:hypothetical protein
MNELNVVVNATQGEITFNLDALKENLAVEMETYKNLVVTEDTVKESKKDLAMLRKVRKELNDKKIEVKKAFMSPYTKFEDEVKEALKIIDEPIALIDSQVKEFEEQAKEEKKNHCRVIWEEKVGNLKEFLPFEKVFRESWLNASTKDKDVAGDLEIDIIRVENDVNAIKALNSEIEDALFEVYKNRGDLSAVIQKNTDYLNTKALAEKKVEEQAADFRSIPDAVPCEISAVVSDNHIYLGFEPEDIQKVKNTLDFAGIKYVEKGV